MSVRSLSEVLTEFIESIETEKVSLADIVEAFHERGFGIIWLIFAAPMALPIPVPPGINVLLATPLLLISAQMMLKRHTLWMPEKIKQRQFSASKLKATLKAVIPWLQKIEVLVKPRLEFMTQSTISSLAGFLGIFMALAVCVPVPLSNTVPSFGIAMMAIGILNRDGLAVLLGMFVGTAWVMGMTWLSIFFGMEGFIMAKDFIKSMLGLA